MFVWLCNTIALDSFSTAPIKHRCFNPVSHIWGFGLPIFVSIMILINNINVKFKNI